jgi:hypothetical protein
MDRLFATYHRRITFAAIAMVLLGAPLWIGQIRVGSLLLTMKSSTDLFNLSEGSIVSAMFATRFFAAYLGAAFTWQNLILAFYHSLRFAGILWLGFIVYLATIRPAKAPYKVLRWSALGIFALQGILYVVVFGSLYLAYNAGSATEATARLSLLGWIMISFSWIEVCIATGSALICVFQLLNSENG